MGRRYPKLLGVICNGKTLREMVLDQPRVTFDNTLGTTDGADLTPISVLKPFQLDGNKRRVAPCGSMPTLIVVANFSGNLIQHLREFSLMTGICNL